MAPEIHDPEAFGLISAVPTCEGDVYSFAMVMWEVRDYYRSVEGVMGASAGVRLTFHSTLFRSSRERCRSQMHVLMGKLSASS